MSSRGTPFGSPVIFLNLCPLQYFCLEFLIPFGPLSEYFFKTNPPCNLKQHGLYLYSFSVPSGVIQGYWDKASAYGLRPTSSCLLVEVEVRVMESRHWPSCLVSGSPVGI